MMQMNGDVIPLGRFRDEDGTEKFVFQIEDQGVIEITWIKNKEGISVFCLPTHYYCNLGCKFCHLTDQGSADLQMNPIPAERLFQIIAAVASSYTKQSKYLLSFMGVGEPFLNLDLVLDSYAAIAETLQTDVNLALASMLLTINPFETLKIRALAENIPAKLHFSLHSPIDSVRKFIIPRANVPVRECLAAVADYGRAVMQNERISASISSFHQESQAVEIHYTIIDGVNDSDKELATLCALGTEYQIPLKLIRFNPTTQLKRSPREKLWLEKLTNCYGAQVVEYAPPGPNIGSSCGQFTKHYYLGSQTPSEEREFENWRAKYQINF